MALFKQCSQPGCRKTLAIEEFGRGGQDCYCKPCRYAAYQKHKQKETLVDIRCDLYVMKNSLLPYFKVGRSADVARRATDLQSGHPFRVLVMAVFPGKGHLEHHVHSKLEAWNVKECPGREWFDCTLAEVLQCIGETLVDLP